MPFLLEDAGNPLSRHFLGDKPRMAVEQAREDTANLVGAHAEEIVFTSCGSEANNLAIKGASQALGKKGKHVIASPIEHHSVLHPLKTLERNGFQVSWLKVDSRGVVSPDEVRALLMDDTVLITVTTASGEIGSIEPIKEIGGIARAKDITFHTDAVAAVGQIPLDVDELGVDLLSVAGNIFYGPLGTGALYVRKGTRLSPIIEGGIQEQGLRAGTHNVAAIVGMGVAARIALDKMTERQLYLTELRDKVIDGLAEKIPDCLLTGAREERLPGHASFCIRFIEGEAILMHLNFAGIAGTSGSTCSSEALKVSHVLEAMGLDPVSAQGSVVFSLGPDNNCEDVSILLEKLPGIVARLRQMSPLAGRERAKASRAMSSHSSPFLSEKLIATNGI